MWWIPYSFGSRLRMHITSKQRQELICPRDLRCWKHLLWKSVLLLSPQWGWWRRIRSIYQCKAHSISGPLENLRVSTKVQMHYFNFITLLAGQNQTYSSFLFWGPPSIPSQKWETEHALPGRTETATLVLAEDVGSVGDLQRLSIHGPHPDASAHRWVRSHQPHPFLGSAASWDRGSWPDGGCHLTSTVSFASPPQSTCFILFSGVVCNMWENYLRCPSSLCFLSSLLLTFHHRVT